MADHTQRLNHLPEHNDLLRRPICCLDCSGRRWIRITPSAFLSFILIIPSHNFSLGQSFSCYSIKYLVIWGFTNDFPRGCSLSQNNSGD